MRLGIGLSLGSRYGGAGTPTPTPASTFDPAKKGAGITLSGGNLTAVGNGVAWLSALSTNSLTTGKRYLEFTNVVTQAGSGIGLGAATANVNSYLGSDTNSVLIDFNGTIYGGVGGTAAAFGSGAVIGLAIDADNNLFWQSVGGVFSGNPAAGTGGIGLPAGMVGATPIFAGMSATSAGGFTANFGATAFAFTPPTGFTAFL